jgi:hypothetical protein
MSQCIYYDDNSSPTPVCPKARSEVPPRHPLVFLVRFFSFDSPGVVSSNSPFLLKEKRNYLSGKRLKFYSTWKKWYHESPSTLRHALPFARVSKTAEKLLCYLRAWSLKDWHCVMMLEVIFSNEFSIAYDFRIFNFLKLRTELQIPDGIMERHQKHQVMRCRGQTTTLYPPFLRSPPSNSPRSHRKCEEPTRPSSRRHPMHKWCGGKTTGTYKRVTRHLHLHLLEVTTPDDQTDELEKKIVLYKTYGFFFFFFRIIFLTCRVYLWWSLHARGLNYQGPECPFPLPVSPPCTADGPP